MSNKIKTIIDYSKIASNFRSVMVASLLPDKLGPIHPEIKNICDQNPKAITYIKPDYTMVDPNMLKHLKQNNIQRVLLTGVQTEWCVTQTALDLKKHGFEVVVLKDAVGSTCPDQHDEALDYLKKHDIEVTPTHNWIVRRLRMTNESFNRWYIDVLKG